MSAIPQLYRGYIYSYVGDEYCYYLGSRFYSPKLGRFLNADKHTDTGTGVNGTNMFAYCNNNPVMFIDPTGEAMRAISLILNLFRKLVQAITKIKPETLSILTTTQQTTQTSKYKCVWPTGKVHIVDDYPSYRSGGEHHGTDFAGKEGDPIYASMSGTVIYCVQKYNNDANSIANPKDYSWMSSGTESWGNYVGIRLDSDNTVVIYYAHQIKNSVVSSGQHVDAGQLIGYIGNTGNSSGPHLHYQVKKNGVNVNPADYLPKV